MKKLSHNWFCDGPIDFEQKRYILLAYLQYVNRHFRETKLYPVLGELVDHYRVLHHFEENRKQLENSFPREMEGIDLRRFRIIYKKVLQDDETLANIEQLVRYSKNQIKAYLNDGKEIYEWIESQIKFYPVGVVPLRKEEGYFILNPSNSHYYVYSFQLSVFSSATDNFRSLKSEFIRSYPRSFTNTFEHIKRELIQTFRHIPNPATYVLETNVRIPVKETFLPIARRMITQQLASE